MSCQTLESPCPQVPVSGNLVFYQAQILCIRNIPGEITKLIVIFGLQNETQTGELSSFNSAVFSCKTQEQAKYQNLTKRSSEGETNHQKNVET